MKSVWESDLEIVHFVSGNLLSDQLVSAKMRVAFKALKTSIFSNNLPYWALLDIKVFNPVISD